MRHTYSAGTTRPGALLPPPLSPSTDVYLRPQPANPWPPVIWSLDERSRPTSFWACPAAAFPPPSHTTPCGYPSLPAPAPRVLPTATSWRQEVWSAIDFYFPLQNFQNHKPQFFRYTLHQIQTSDKRLQKISIGRKRGEKEETLEKISDRKGK